MQEYLISLVLLLTMIETTAMHHNFANQNKPNIDIQTSFR